MGERPACRSSCPSDRLTFKPAARAPRAADPGPTAPGAAPAALHLRGISKRFGVVQAVDGVDLRAARRRGPRARRRERRGQVHAHPDRLRRLSARQRRDPAQGPARSTSPAPAEAEAAGISVVYQELSLVPDLDVAENVYLHREPRRARLFLDNARLHAQCRAYLEDLGIDVDPRARVSTLSVAQQQLVEIAKALSRDAEVVIFDEPTASLTSVEEEHLFSLIRRLARPRQRHRLRLAPPRRDLRHLRRRDRAQGRPPGAHDAAPPTSITTPSSASWSAATWSRNSTRRVARRRPRTGQPLLRVVDASSPGRIQGVSLEVWPGEIVGLAGLIGSGRTSLLRAIFGADESAVRRLTVDGVGGRPLSAWRPSRRASPS